MKTIVLAGKHYSAFRERLNTVSTHSDEAKLIRVNQNLPISQSMDDLRYAISIRLPGQNEDPITGLYDNGYRQYDPSVGRYLTPDPMGTVDGLNPYLYVGNNPLNKVDPYGLYQTDMHYYITYFLAITAGIDSDNARRIALATQFVDENRYTAPMITGHLSIYFPEDMKATISGGLLVFANDMISTFFANASSNKLDWYHFVNDRSANSSNKWKYLNDPTYTSRINAHNYDLKKPNNMSSTEYEIWRLRSNLDNIPRLITMSDNYKEAAKCGNMNLSMQFFGEYLHAYEDTFAHRNKENIPYEVNAGFGHALGGTNPDHTYNEDSWDVNSNRTLVAQASTYAKLVDYRRNILKIPDNQTKTIPWSELKKYIEAFNLIKEDHDNHIQGSLGTIQTKINYLESLLNTKWKYKTTSKKPIDLINKVNNEYIKGSDGYDVPLALATRIDVLSKVTDKVKYTDVVWETSIKLYISHDRESQTSVSKARNYSYTLKNGKYIINGTPPIQPLK